LVTARRIIHFPGHGHFVTFSTYQRRRFLEPDQTRNIVVEVLQRCLSAHKASCTGFVVMPNHVHAIFFGEPDFSIGNLINAWKKTSSYRIKRFYLQEFFRYQQLCPQGSPIWQARYYDFNLESQDKTNEKLDYMHENPVKAGIAETPAAWTWSSASFYERGEAVGVTITP